MESPGLLGCRGFVDYSPLMHRQVRPQFSIAHYLDCRPRIEPMQEAMHPNAPKNRDRDGQLLLLNVLTTPDSG